MPTKLTRVEEVLRTYVPTASTLTDAAVMVTCPACETYQSLADATVEHHGADTTYTCVKQCQPVVIVSDGEAKDLPGRGHRFGPYLIRNVSEMNVAATETPLKIEASPAALQPISGRTKKYRL
jgi:hypothetical protein